MSTPTVDPSALRERDFQNLVISLAEMYGWGPIYHAPQGGKNGRVDREQRGAGFPDLVLLHQGEGRLILAELKTDRGRVSQKQHAWLAALEIVAAANPLVEVYIWRPADWDTIAQTLGGRG